METLLLGLFYISTLYAFIPGVITRLFGFRVFRHGVSKDNFALTFDDGPDPIYTPKLLDLLELYGAKATFFVVGSNAEKYPELVQRMHEEGHLIGIHNYVHKTNWLMAPATVKKQIQKTTKIIHDITGITTHYYRPPWGIVNLFDFAKRNETQIVLWSAMFGDWRQRIGADRLTKRMMKKLRGGEVFLLHDCGTTLGANSDAPVQMLIALERVLQEAQQRGLQSIRIDEMIEISHAAKKKGTFASSSPVGEKSQHRAKPALTRTKKFIVSLWLLWERIFHFLFQLKTTNQEDPIFYFRPRYYHGETVTMVGDIPLVSGDRVLELHFDNKKLFQIGTRSRSSIHLAIQMIRGVEKTLPELAQYVIEHPELHDVKALYGVTMINRGPEQLGFTVTDLPNSLFAKSSKIYLKFLMSVIHPSGGARLKQSSSKELVPKLLVMPIELLLERYSDGGSHRKLKDDRRKQQEGTSEITEVQETEAVFSTSLT
ncbi:peptidoglycan/xylan/chitin deacetylase (PgdA/CDA1 family) [Paenibacillus anaericanus]|uniref:polysaccharide deacetylase family protein n=1 Tax=Paenibacillus anaericanus TaxID=170367 RepID=UPI0027865DAD|nr:polysaccharide deacetylase family protein [Paenibacillus anaericanus]MDQ0090065.1 peptidoglycan/xylan/chitin deacetylase (PgdA/CDA1 family) [Paenibacillus anaericanus]